MAEKWPIILKNFSMLGDSYNAPKNASIIYLGLVTSRTAFTEVVRRKKPLAFHVPYSLYPRMVDSSWKDL